MVHAGSQHPNAVLTPEGRRRMVSLVIDDGWTIEATAEQFQIDAKTVRKWRDRYVSEGPNGLMDRSNSPRRRSSPTRLPRAPSAGKDDKPEPSHSFWGGQRIGMLALTLCPIPLFAQSLGGHG